MFAKDPSVVTLDQRRSGAHAGMPSSTSLFEARAAARPGAGGGGTRDVVICPAAQRGAEAPSRGRRRRRCRQVVVEKVGARQGFAPFRGRSAEAQRAVGGAPREAAREGTRRTRQALVLGDLVQAALEGPAPRCRRERGGSGIPPGPDGGHPGRPWDGHVHHPRGWCRRTLHKQGARANRPFSLSESFVMRSCVVVPRASQIVKKEQHLRALKKRQWFGELALTSNALRNATVRAALPDAGGDLAVALYGNEKPNLRLLKMSQQSFVKVCERDGGSTSETMEALRTQCIREVVASIEELRNIPDKLLNSLVKVMRPVKFTTDNDYICTQGVSQLVLLYHLRRARDRDRERQSRRSKWRAVRPRPGRVRLLRRRGPLQPRPQAHRKRPLYGRTALHGDRRRQLPQVRGRRRRRLSQALAAQGSRQEDPSVQRHCCALRGRGRS